MLLFGARVQCLTKGMFPFKAERAALGRAATKSPELSSALAAGENGISGFKSPTFLFPQAQLSPFGCPRL